MNAERKALTEHASSRLISVLAAWFVAGAALLSVACDSDADKVCTDVGNCSHGGSDDWITGCRDQNKQLSDEAKQTGCGSVFDAYFSCAEEHFACNGDKSDFPGCEGSLDALSACIDGAQASTSCGELAARLDACATPPPPPPIDDGSAGLGTCTASDDCSSLCYLEQVTDVCAPTPSGLSAFADCATHCVF